MKLVALAAAAFVVVSAPASAQYYGPRPMAPIGPLPPESVSQMVRQMGLEPVGAPVRSGPVYFQRAADYYGKPLRVVIDAHRAQVVMVEPIGGPPMLHGGPYASTGGPYWRRPYGYPYGMPDDEAIAPPGSVMTPHGQPPQAGLPPATQAKPAPKSAAITPKEPPVPRKRPVSAPQQAAGSVEPVAAPQATAPVVEKPAAVVPPPPEKPANAMPPVTPLE
ncbi:MAG: hypothetical protein WDO17_24710 [Alphaproteobacteria bacterium]